MEIVPSCAIVCVQKLDRQAGFKGSCLFITQDTYKSPCASEGEGQKESGSDLQEGEE